MGRINNATDFGAGFNIGAASPIDSRMRVEYLSDLTNSATWPPSKAPIYRGMSVLVEYDNDTVNKHYIGARYVLIDPSNYESMSAWKFEGTQVTLTPSPTSNNISLDVKANTYYEISGEVSTITINSAEFSTLESEIHFVAKSASVGIEGGAIIINNTSNPTFPYIGNYSISAGLKVFISIKNGVIAVYNEGMATVDSTFNRSSENLATSAAIGAWVENYVQAQIEESTRDVKSNWTLDDSANQTYILNKPTLLWTSHDISDIAPTKEDELDPDNTVPKLVSIYDPDGATGCLHEDGHFREVWEKPNFVEVTIQSVSITVEENTIYKCTYGGGISDLTLDITNVVTTNFESIIYFQASSDFTIVMNEGTSIEVLGSLDIKSGKTYSVNIKDGILLVTPSELPIADIKLNIDTDDPSNNPSVVSDGEALLPNYVLMDTTAMNTFNITSSTQGVQTTKNAGYYLVPIRLIWGTPNA